MIDVKTITKPKQSGGIGGSSTKTTYVNTTVSEADHASRADKATRADKAATADYASKSASAQIATYAMKAGELDGNSETLKNYLYKGETTEEQTVMGSVDFAGKLTFEKLASFLQGLKVGDAGTWQIDADGKAVLSKLILDLLQSSDYSEATQTGFGFYRRKDGKYGLNITDLLIWGKAVFNSLEIRKLYSVGGNIVLSPSASKIMKVEEVTAETSGEVTGWKCWLLADDGTMATTNQWMADDQVRCQTFNIAEGVYDNVGNKSYWRRITEVSQQNETISDKDGNILYDGKKFAWVVLSKSDCEEGSDTPAPDDTIVCMGNRTNTDRQHLIMLETTGDSAPSIRLYRGVNSYSLTDRAIFDASYSGIRIVSQYFSFVGASGEKEWTPNYRGEWQEGTEYGYYDQVDHEGTLWLCLAPEGSPTTTEPSEDNDLWRAMTAIVPAELIIQRDFDGFRYGTVGNIQCYVRRGATDLTSCVSTWKVTRDSGSEQDDLAWNQSAKAKNFDGTLQLSCTDTDNDFGDADKVVFYFTAKGDTKTLATKALKFV